MKNAALKREESDARISSPEREQYRQSQFAAALKYMKKILLAVLFAFTMCLQMNAQVSLSGRVYHCANMMKEELQDMNMHTESRSFYRRMEAPFNYLSS